MNIGDIVSKVRIGEAFEVLRTEPPKTHAIIVNDPIRYREATNAFFGQRGMSWHGSVIFYRAGDEEPTVDPRTKEKKENISAIYVDHICVNDRKQDRIAIVSILGALSHRVPKELPTVKKFYSITDNANCFQNDLLAVIAPFIAKSHHMEILGMIHPASQCGKGHADAHFAVGMRHIRRYVNEMKTDAYCPTHVITALRYQGGMENYVKELYSIYRNCNPIASMLRAVSEKRLCRMGRVSEFQYIPHGDGFLVHEYEFSGGQFKTYRITPDYTCKVYNCGMGGINQQFNIEGALVANSEVECHDGGDENYSQSIINPEDEHPVNVEDSLDNVSHGNQEADELLGNSECKQIGKLTGFKLWSEARKRRYKRRIDIRVGSALSDACTEREADGSEDELGTDNNSHGLFHTCSKCDRRYIRHDCFIKHYNKCKGLLRVRSCLNRAIGLSFEMISTGEFVSYQRYENHPMLKDMTVKPETYDRHTFAQGWEVRPKMGETLGWNTTAKYMDKIRDGLRWGTGRGVKR